MRRTFIALAAMTLLAAAASAQQAVTATTEVFVTAKPTDVLSSNLIDLNITNAANETIGEIKDLIISQGDLNGYVVAVGGFLGLGERYVVVHPNAVQISYTENDRKWHAVMNTTKDQLKGGARVQVRRPLEALIGVTATSSRERPQYVAFPNLQHWRHPCSNRLITSFLKTQSATSTKSSTKPSGRPSRPAIRCP